MNIQKDSTKGQQGYLQKWVNMWQGWQRRYFIIQDKFLVYKEAPDAKTKCTINLEDADMHMSANDALKMVISYAGNTFKLRAATVSEKVQWMDWLRQAKAKKAGLASVTLPLEDRKDSDEQSKTTVKSPDPRKRSKDEPKEEGVTAHISDLETKNKELVAILKKRFTQENNTLVSHITKIYSIQNSMEDTLTAYVARVQSAVKDEKLKDMSEKLESECNELKAEIVEALGSAALSKSRHSLPGDKNDKSRKSDHAPQEDSKVSAEEAKAEDRKDEESSSESSSSFNDEEFDTANEEEISKNMSNSNSMEETEHRMALPAKRSNLQKVSVWRVLKDMIGKDLTHFTLPIYFIEPITMLQKVAECLEYEQLLRKAGQCGDSLMRMAYVISFLIAQYADTVNRTKKPFNPILGETYEYVTRDYKFFSEQVSHHPPISACHCHSELYEFWMHTHMKFSFWGKSLEGTPLGSFNVFLKKYNERYIISRPVSAACNIILGTMYIDNYGDCVAKNQSTGETAKINFKKKGWFGKHYGDVNVSIFDSAGTAVYELYGKWTDYLKIKKLTTGEEQLLWQRNERPPEWENYYYFTEFAYQLNNLTERMKKVLPPNDSRFRPDLRALENGDLKLSAAEKNRLEDLQRAMRKQKEKDKDKTEYKPAYFVEDDDPITKEKTYKFTWKYWKDREAGSWKHLPHLFY